METIEAKLERELLEAFEEEKKAKVKLTELDQAIKAMVHELGEGYAFRGPDGVVYQVTDCAGRFVYNRPYDLKHTTLPDGTKATLSQVKAQELGV